MSNWNGVEARLQTQDSRLDDVRVDLRALEKSVVDLSKDVAGYSAHVEGMTKQVEEIHRHLLGNKPNSPTGAEGLSTLLYWRFWEDLV